MELSASKRVVVFDYGFGNVRSAERALARAGADVEITRDYDTAMNADGLLVPGVGAFAACMANVAARPGLVEAMTEAVTNKGVPFLGVCVGMQMLAERGLEFGETPGLGWIPGEVRRIEPAGHQFKVPHMGWNALAGVASHPLFEGIAAGDHMYFTHSFAFHPANPADVTASADHGGVFTAAVAHGNIAGVQFHPEKSQAAGLRLLSNFLEWRP